MKLKDMKLSELKKLCGGKDCFACRYQDEDNSACFFTLSRIPCQWDVESEPEQIVEQLDQTPKEMRIRALEHRSGWHQEQMDLIEKEIERVETY